MPGASPTVSRRGTTPPVPPGGVDECDDLAWSPSPERWPLATTAFGATRRQRHCRRATSPTGGGRRPPRSAADVRRARRPRADVRAESRADPSRGAAQSVTSGNTAIGRWSVTSTGRPASCSRRPRRRGVKAAGAGRLVGRAPRRRVSAGAGRRSSRPPGSTPTRASRTGMSAAAKKGKKGASDPLDSYAVGHGHDRRVRRARASSMGDKRVKVGVMDTGVDGSHLGHRAELRQHALAQLHHRHASTSTVPCEVRELRRPGARSTTTGTARTSPARSAGGHERDRASRASRRSVDARRTCARGQDSGYFFLVADGERAHVLRRRRPRRGQHVVLRRPVGLQLRGSAPPRTPRSEAAEQDVIIEAMTRALDYAHDARRRPSWVPCGNGHERPGQPAPDTSSPD